MDNFYSFHFDFKNPDSPKLGYQAVEWDPVETELSLAKVMTKTTPLLVENPSLISVQESVSCQMGPRNADANKTRS